MKHFDDIEWLFYKKDLVTGKKKIEMEDHLYTCNDCLKIFTSLINEKEIKKASEIISVNFKEDVQYKIKDIKIFNNRKSASSQKPINDFFLQYVAVALVAIVLTGGGFFGNMVDSVTKIEKMIDIKDSRVKADSIYKLSEKISNETSVFVNNFKLKKEDDEDEE